MCSFEVEYIGWKLYGMTLQLVPVGSNWICPNPFAALAVIDPSCPVVRSCRTTWKPAGVSCMATTMRSPPFIIRSCDGSGTRLVGLSTEFFGSGGPCGRPLRVTKAKLMYSTPPRICDWQVGFRACPVAPFSDRLSIVRAAHQRAGSQLVPMFQFAQPGG